MISNDRLAFFFQYQNALRLDPGNMQIMQDLYLLQIQTRNVMGFCETRRILLTMKPNNRINWIGFAVGYHLNGNIQVLDTLNENRTLTYEDSELYLYRAQSIQGCDVRAT